MERQFPETLQLRESLRNLAGEVVAVQVEDLEVSEVSDLDRYHATQVVVAER